MALPSLNECRPVFAHELSRAVTLRQVVQSSHVGTELPRALGHRVKPAYSQLVPEQTVLGGLEPCLSRKYSSQKSDSLVGVSAPH